MSDEKKINIYAVIEKHPNGIGPLWVGIVGNKKEIKGFLKKEDLDYVYAVFELKQGGQDATENFLIMDEETYDFTGVK